MPRVIQDSDDEDAVSQASNFAGAGEDPTAPASSEASQPVKAVASAATKSTSSSEKLRREIQMAHTALLEPTPAANRKRRAADDFDVPSSSTVKEQGKPKRARTLDHSSGSRSKGSTGSLKTPSNKQTQATDHSSRISFDWEVPRSSPDGGPIERAQRQPIESAVGLRVSELRNTNRSCSIGRHTVADQQDELSPHDTIVDTPSSERETGTGSPGPPVQGTQFEEHNPNELFPNSTLASTATDPLHDKEGHAEAEEVTPAAEAGEDTQGESTTRSANRRDSVDELQPPSQQSQHVSQEEQPRRADGGDMEATGSGKITWTKRTSKSITSQDENLKSPPQTTSDDLVDLPKEQYKPRPSRSRGGGSTEETVIDLTMPPPPPKAKKSRPSRSKTTGFTFASPKSKLLEMGFTTSQADWALMQADGNADEAANLLTGGTPKERKGTQKTRRSAIAVEDQEDSESDEEDTIRVQPTRGQKHKKSVGQAAEQAEEAETIQVKPTQTRKRKKRTETEKEAHEEESEDDIICRTKRKRGAKTAAESANDQAADAATVGDAEDPDDEDEVVAPRSKRKKKGPESEVAGDEAEQDEQADGAAEATETAQQVGGDTSAGNVDQAQQDKKKKGRGRPKKSDVVVEDVEASASEHNSEHEVEEEEEPPAHKDKKKGRGRPKKTQQVSERPKEGPITESIGKTLAAQAQEQTPLQEKDANTSRKETTPASESTPIHGAAQTSCDMHVEEHQKTSPQKKHSPLNKGRVPFKVGLSRRMRIEPLLKIVKKK